MLIPENQNLYKLPTKTELSQSMVNKPNKLFNIGTIPISSHVSKVKSNRDYLLSAQVADELNTYRTWDIFPVANDAYVSQYDDNGKEIEPLSYPGAPGVRSIFNKSGAVMLGGNTGSGYDITKTSSEWRISNNVPLMDSPEVRKRIRKNSGCSVKELVDASTDGSLGRETYSYSDFMYCKYLGKVSNNYLITLRRFPLPVDDYISSVGEGATRTLSSIQSQNGVSIGCMVTWMGTPGNDISNILKYSYKMPFKFQNADWHSAQGNDYDSGRGPLNAIAAAMDPTYRKHYQQGEVGSIFNDYIGRHFKAGDAHYNLSQMQEWTDNNKVYGPVDAIKGSYMRDSSGLEFDQKISLQFDYELRSYNGINPRQAMLDLLSNILNVTYTTGTFWGGGYRGYGAGQSNIFTNMKIFKANGGFSSFIDAAMDDATNLLGAGKSFGDGSISGIVKTLANVANQLGGMILGGFLNKLGRPAKSFANSLLSPAPVGFWHLTIGNPHHPIMSLGNMIITNTTIEHYGPLGLDDFPTGLRVTVELERGKPRDVRDIEKIYMHGNDRIYSSMGQEIQRMYEKAKEYKGKQQTNYYSNGSEIKDSTNRNAITKDELQNMKGVWQKYFGTSDVESIKIAAMEQENGSQKKRSKTASGDSRRQGTGVQR